LQAENPNLKLHVPSVLDGLSFWQTLRAAGDTLKNGDVWGRTGIRHFNLAAKRLDRWLDVPLSSVSDDGQPTLYYSNAEYGLIARLAVG